MRFLPLLLTVLIAGCAPFAGEMRWGAVSPVDFAIDRSMPSECIDAAYEGWAFWRQYTDRLVPREMPGEYLGFHGHVAFAEVTITARTLDGFTAGQTLRETNGQGRLKSASIVVDPAHCKSVNVAAHELGHALGLEHNPDPESLMYWRVSGSLHLNREEIEWVK